MKSNIFVTLLLSLVCATSFAQINAEDVALAAAAEKGKKISTLREEISAKIKNAAEVKTATLKGGIKYEGQMKGKKPNGYGRALYPNGDKYEGEFSRGVRQGLGIYTYSDGLLCLP